MTIKPSDKLDSKKSLPDIIPSAQTSALLWGFFSVETFFSKHFFVAPRAVPITLILKRRSFLSLQNNPSLSLSVTFSHLSSLNCYVSQSVFFFFLLNGLHRAGTYTHTLTRTRGLRQLTQIMATCSSSSFLSCICSFHKSSETILIAFDSFE